MRELRIDVGGTTLAVYEWGDSKAVDAVVCAHGLTRNGRDFDRLAAALAAKRRVISFDFAGRGESDWLEDPAAYVYPTYIDHALKLLVALNIAQVDWVGTSMGGLVGMMLAAAGDASVVRRLVLNDVGPFIPKEALKHIAAAHIHHDGSYPTRAAAEEDLRAAYAGFGPIDEAAWADFFVHGLKDLPSGGCCVTYDPAIFTPLTANEITDVDLSPVWAATKVPTLVLRGAHSGLLQHGVAQKMLERGDVTLVEVAGCGHAPSLTQPDQIKIITDFLGV